MSGPRLRFGLARMTHGCRHVDDTVRDTSPMRKRRTSPQVPRLRVLKLRS